MVVDLRLPSTFFYLLRWLPGCIIEIVISVKVTQHIKSIKMTSISVTFHPEELHNLCNKNKISCKQEEAFDRIRQWLNHNKVHNTRLKAALTYQDEYNRTPLHVIIEICPPFDIIQMFINYAPEALQMMDGFGELPIHRACENGASLEVLQALVKSYPQIIEITDIEDTLPLHDACWKADSLDTVTLLVETYPGIVEVTTYNGDLPLHYACQSQKKVSLEALTFLIHSYPDGMHQRNQYNQTPLDCLKGSEYAMHTDDNGMLALHHACKDGYSLHLILFLIQAYPESTIVQDNDGNTPLQYLKETASHIDKNGMSFLHHEAMHFSGLNVEMLHVLFHANPEAIRLQDKSGLLPIHYAILNKASSLDALMALLKFYPESIAV